MINHKNDFQLDYFGFKTLERAYLLKIGERVLETPQFMFMRVAVGIHENDLEEIEKTYYYMSNLYFTHATPTLFNAGTVGNQMSSCFLMGKTEDSVTGIFKTVSDCAQISKFAGGIGLSLHNIRSNGSYIRGTEVQLMVYFHL